MRSYENAQSIAIWWGLNWEETESGHVWNEAPSGCSGRTAILSAACCWLTGVLLSASVANERAAAAVAGFHVEPQPERERGSFAQVRREREIRPLLAVAMRRTLAQADLQESRWTSNLKFGRTIPVAEDLSANHFVGKSCNARSELAHLRYNHRSHSTSRR